MNAITNAETTDRTKGLSSQRFHFEFERVSPMIQKSSGIKRKRVVPRKSVYGHAFERGESSKDSSGIISPIKISIVVSHLGQSTIVHRLFSNRICENVKNILSVRVRKRSHGFPERGFFPLENSLYILYHFTFFTITLN